MPMPARTVAAALMKKGFIASNRHHRMFLYQKQDGTLTSIKTRISHGESELSDFHVAQMAKQCLVSKADFNRFVACRLSREEYESKVCR